MKPVVAIVVVSLVLHGCCVFADDQCKDNDAAVRAAAAERGGEEQAEVSGCIDLLEMCASETRLGTTVRDMCCETCAGVELPDASLPPNDPTSPLQVYLLSGQSDCKGQASVRLLEKDETYAELAGVQEGVWFAGYAGAASRDSFFINQMRAGDEHKNMFGPEISMGPRLHEVTGVNTLVMKYCVGGTQVREHWNPSTARNSWDHSLDEGTADWLLANTDMDFSSKSSLFVNLAYTVRRTKEALAAAGIAYKWSGMMWVQGQGDVPSTWEEYGINEARFFDAVREVVGVWDLPVIDNGSSSKHNLRSGKEYARQLVKGCNAVVVDMGGSSADPDSSCISTATSPCPNATFINTDLYNYYGWDPNLPAELRGNDKTFHWWKAYPTNLHSEYEGMVVKGRMLANQYIRSFTDIPLPEGVAAQDPGLIFPWPVCTPAGSGKPSANNVCWVDERDSETRSSACTPQPPENTGPEVPEPCSAERMDPLWSEGTTPPLLGQPYDDDTSNLDSNARQRRRLDLYYSSAAEAGVGPVPLMIFVHGGGWRGKDTSDVLTKLEFLDWRQYGYSVASLGYRLSQHAVHPAQIEDVKAGVTWLRAHAAEHNLDPDRFIIFGTSAGGHLSSLLATTASQPSDESRVAALMDFFGPTNFGLPEDVNPEFGQDPTSNVALLLGCAPLDCPEAFVEVNPAAHIDATDPPMLILHGTADETVPYMTSESFYNKAIAAGVDATLVITEGAGHFYNAVLKPNGAFTVTPQQAARDTPVATMLGWLQDRGLALGCNGAPTPVPSPAPGPTAGPIDNDNDDEEDEGTMQSCILDNCGSEASKCNKDVACKSMSLSLLGGGKSNPDLNQAVENAQFLALSDCLCIACTQFGRIQTICDALLMEPSPKPSPTPSPTPSASPTTDSSEESVVDESPPESPTAAPESTPTPGMEDTSIAQMFTLSPVLLLAALWVVGGL